MRRFLCLFMFLSPCLWQVAFAADCDPGLQFAPAGEDTWHGWGADAGNTRNNSSDSNPIDGAALPRLGLKWAYGFADVRSVIGNPALHGNRIFIGDEKGRVHALDRDSGCEDWIFQADNGVRTMPLVQRIDGRWLVFFGDRSANMYAVDAVTGAQVWKTRVDDHSAAILTGAPQFVRLENEAIADRIIIGVSSGEEGLGAVPSYACCSFQGSVVALAATNGDTLWKIHTILEAVRETSPGKFGPSGAAVWSTPTVDLGLEQLYVTTGDAYSAPAAPTTDAVLALDLASGEMRWSRQGTPDDIWTVACMTPNAFPECGPDQDYGSPAMLVPAAGDALVAGQKSGIVRRYDRRTGEMLWQTALVENTTEFGGKIIWGGAADAANSYWGMGNNDIAAVRHGDGAVAWQRTIPPAAGMENHPGLEGPVTVSHDILFSGSWDGRLRALSTATGEILWEFDTAREFNTVNGVPASGGSMGAVGPVVEDGLLLVTSGYIGVKNGAPGNVLLVFDVSRQ